MCLYCNSKSKTNAKQHTHLSGGLSRVFIDDISDRRQKNVNASKEQSDCVLERDIVFCAPVFSVIEDNGD